MSRVRSCCSVRGGGVSNLHLAHAQNISPVVSPSSGIPGPQKAERTARHSNSAQGRFLYITVFTKRRSPAAARQNFPDKQRG